jgi:hypothetical protein
MANRSPFASWPATCAVLAAAALCAPALGQEGRDAPEADDAPREARVCLDHPMVRRTRVLNNRNIVFVTRANEIYNNRLPEDCPSLRRGSLVRYPIEQRRFCAGSSFQVLWETTPNNYMPAFVCKLGYFVPITEDELEDLLVETAPDRDRRPRRRSRREAITVEQVELPAPPPADGGPPPTE